MKIYSCEHTKRTGGLLAAKVARIVNSEMGTQINARSITKYFSMGRTGDSPKKLVQMGEYSKDKFALLCGAFESYFCISQLNACESMSNRKNLMAKLNDVMDSKHQNLNNKSNLLNRFLK